MSFLLKNRSILPVLKRNYGPQNIRNICGVVNRGDMTKRSENNKTKVLFWLHKRNESTNSSSETSTSSAEESSSKFNRDHYDVIIVGGGMIGASLACSLAKHPTLADKKVLMLEGASKFKGATKDKYSNRCSAINHQTVNLLKTIDAYDYVESTRIKPIMQMQVWDACSDARITFNHDNFSDTVAYVVENDLILESVYKQLKNLPNVEMQSSSRIASCKLKKDGALKNEVSLRTGENLTCELLIGADGANSIVRKQMEIDNFSMSYRQMGIVANLELNEEETAGNTIAWQRFLPTGPLAMLPLTDNLSSLVWTTNYDHAKQLLRMSPAEFVDALNHAFVKTYKQDKFVENVMTSMEKFLGLSTQTVKQLPPKVTAIQEKTRAAFPLTFGHASSYVSEGVAIIGDAAHRVHPLAGQGANLGFGDVVCLTEVLGRAVYNGSTLSDMNYLLEYERSRLKVNVPMLLGCHGLHHIYGNEFSPLVLARSIGLRVTDSIPPLKKFFMDRAMT